MEQVQSISVLVADGEKSVQDGIKAMLHGTEFSLWEASNPQEALEYARRPGMIAIDLLLVDAGMLSLQAGFLDQMTELRPELKILLMSDRPVEALQDSGVYPSEEEYLRNPFSREDLVTSLRGLGKMVEPTPSLYVSGLSRLKAT